MEKAAGSLLLPGAALAAALLLLGATFASAALLPFGISMGLNILGLLALATALFLATTASLKSPTRGPALRRGAAAILFLGGAAVLLMTPFAAMALAAFARV